MPYTHLNGFPHADYNRLRNRCATVAPPFGRFARVNDPRSYRRAFGHLTLSALGKLLGAFHPNGHGYDYDKSSLWYWEHGRRMNTGVQTAYVALAQAILAERTGGRISVRAHFGRKWKFTPAAACHRCTRPFVPKRLSDVRCPRCCRRSAPSKGRHRRGD